MRILRYLALACITVALCMTLAHVLEIPGKLRLKGPEWLVVQQNLYIAWGLTGGLAELGAIVFAGLAARLDRGRPDVARPALLAAIASVLGLAVWALVVAPVNAQLNGWTAISLPTEWQEARNRWEAGHAAGAVLFAVAFVAILRAIVRDAPALDHRPPAGPG